MRNKLYKILAAGFALAMAFTLSCSGSIDDPDGGGGGNGEGMTNTYDIENLDEANHSFKIIYKSYDCQENGTMKEHTLSEAASYSINGTALSFKGVEYTGNSASIIGTWTREPFSASCENDYNYQCKDNNRFSKAVFTPNSLALTFCLHKIGKYEYTDDDGVAVIRNYIDCNTEEHTKGTQTVRVTYSGTDVTATYKDKGKFCKFPSSSSSYPKEQREKACTDAYSKVIKENPGYDGSGYHSLVEDAYYEILYKELDDCLRNNLPEWFH